MDYRVDYSSHERMENAGSTGSGIDVRTTDRSASLFQSKYQESTLTLDGAGAHHNVKNVRHIYYIHIL